jgi:uncharacterized protein (UPF0248 family)
MDTKPLGHLFRSLTMLFCLAFLITPVLAESNTICFLTVLNLRDGGQLNAQNYVIKDKGEWESLWARLFPESSVRGPLPETDFERRTLLAVFQGNKATSGYEISIREVVESEKALEVSVKAFAPGKHCIVTGNDTSPFQIIEIPKTEKEVVFKVKQKIRNCD